MIFRNDSPIGDLEIAGHGLVKLGDKFVVLPENLAGLIGNTDLTPVDDEAIAARAAYDAPIEPAPPVEPVTPAVPPIAPPVTPTQPDAASVAELAAKAAEADAALAAAEAAATPNEVH